MFRVHFSPLRNWRRSLPIPGPDFFRNLHLQNTRQPRLSRFPTQFSGEEHLLIPSNRLSKHSLIPSREAHALPSAAFDRTSTNGASRLVSKTSAHAENSELGDQSIFVDAALTWGIGLWINGHSLAWRFRKGTRSELNELGSNWAELLAIEMSLRYLTARGAVSDTSFLIRSDNMFAIKSLNVLKARNMHAAAIIDNIASIFRTYRVVARAEHVPGLINPADGPSRGRCSERKLSYNFELSSHLMRWLEPVSEYRDI